MSTSRVAYPGCFIPDPDRGSRIQTFFHPGYYMNSGMQTYFFLAVDYETKKEYVYRQCCVSGMFYPGSGSKRFLILDPGSEHFYIPDPT
jgi:hypothetical protein